MSEYEKEEQRRKAVCTAEFKGTDGKVVGIDVSDDARLIKSEADGDG